MLVIAIWSSEVHRVEKDLDKSNRGKIKKWIQTIIPYQIWYIEIYRKAMFDKEKFGD